jgi:hypothetical protein
MAGLRRISDERHKKDFGQDEGERILGTPEVLARGRAPFATGKYKKRTASS